MVVCLREARRRLRFSLFGGGAVGGGSGDGGGLLESRGLRLELFRALELALELRNRKGPLLYSNTSTRPSMRDKSPTDICVVIALRRP